VAFITSGEHYGAVLNADFDYRRYLTAVKADEYGIYFDGDSPARVMLDLPAGLHSGEWVNVKTGSVERAEDFQAAGKEIILQSPEFKNGIALRLKRSVR